MSLRHYLATMILATVLCWLAWIFVLINVDPFETSPVGLAFFYLSLFLAGLGTWSLALFGLYWFWHRATWPLFRYVQKSFREAIWISLFATLLLWLQGQKYLTPLNGLLLGGLFILLISFSLSLKPRGGREISPTGHTPASS